MKFITTILALVLLSACQQSDSQDKKTANEEKAPVAAEQVAGDTPTVENTPSIADQALSEPSPEEKMAAAAEVKHEEETAHSDDLMKYDGATFTEIEPQYTCDKPLVIEFFAYQCPHCYALEPYVEAWLKQNDGKVDYLPVPTHLGHNEFGSLLLVHHAAKKLGILAKVMPAMFDRVHKEKRLFASPEEAADFLVSLGADKDQALAALNDQKAIGDEVEADFQMMAKYKIASVPRVLVNHQYMTDISAAGGPDKVFPLVDELLQKPSACKK